MADSPSSSAGKAPAGSEPGSAPGQAGAHVAWIGLGANLGDTMAALQGAVQDLTHADGIASVTTSRFFRTAPIDSSGPPYLNAAARVVTTLDPLALLDTLQRIETTHGRERPYRNAPRTLDLDLLLFDDVVMDTPRLVIPHPRMHERGFVLAPLCDLDPALRLPQGDVMTLLRACAAQDVVAL
jgi:2-amino-4-hydroxy-6-hydroxymethyldihydropteridine diphosphokinase